MTATSIIEDIQNMQKNLIDFLDADLESDESFRNLRTIFDSQKIREDKTNLMELLDILNNIFNNHHRGPLFISKIEQILNYFKESIKQFFTQTEIMTIFDNNRILLYFIKEKIITIDEHNATQFFKKNPVYFYPETSCFQKVQHSIYHDYDDPNNELIKDFKLPENFEELRQKGENESKICELIRNDSIDDFIVYVNENNISLHSTINYSFYETNSLLTQIQEDTRDVYDYYRCKFVQRTNKEKNTLIDYAAFFGSIKIFKYLRLNDVKLTSSTFLCSIHGNNSEMIFLFEEIKNKQNKSTDQNEYSDPRRGYYQRYNSDYEEEQFENYGNNYYDDNLDDDNDFYDDFEENNYNYNQDRNDNNNNNDDDANLSSYDSVLIEAIKCYHNEVANYFISNDYGKNVNKLKIALEYHNFEFINETKINQRLFYLLCQYNYVKLVSFSCNKLELSNYYLNGQTPLFVAVKSENIEIVKILLNDDSIDINYLNDVFF